MKRTLFPVLSVFFFAGVSFGGTVKFDVTTEPGFDGGNDYDNFREAGAGTNTVFAMGFQIDIREMNGSATSVTGPLATFCTELQEPIDVGSYTHRFAELGKISRGRAGEAGTASSAIPVGGIGAISAARVRALFDNRYQSSTLSSWGSAVETQAFQLALWEATHDTDLSLSLTSGSIYVGAQTGIDQTSALTLAQTWLDELSGVTNGYVSTTWDVWALENVGTVGQQDLLFATAKGSPNSVAIGGAVPEPSSAMLLIVGAAVLGLRRRR